MRWMTSPLPNPSPCPYKDAMSVYKTLSDLPIEAKGHVIAIGNFDGVHLGHRALLSRAKEIAKKQGTKVGVLTFEPHPRKLFRPDEPPFRITPMDIKHTLLLESGVDFIVSLTFDWNFASQSAEDFVQNILIKSLNAHHVVIGDDFKFGQLRKGHAGTIKDAGIAVTTVSPVGDHTQHKYASSTIRNSLRMGDIDAANKILGWEWTITGMIVRGDRRGHDLGYPTANVPLGDILHPAYGVYATWVRIDGEDLWRPAATNIGIRPMFELKVGQVEAHILEFEDRDIYGKNLTIRPVKRLRGEAKFDSLPALIAQIDADCEQTKSILMAAQV